MFHVAPTKAKQVKGFSLNFNAIFILTPLVQCALKRRKRTTTQYRAFNCLPRVHFLLLSSVPRIQHSFLTHKHTKSQTHTACPPMLPDLPVEYNCQAGAEMLCTLQLLLLITSTAKLHTLTRLTLGISFEAVFFFKVMFFTMSSRA